MVLVVSCRHLVQVRVLANFLRQTLFQVVHSPNLKTQKTRRLLNMAVFGWKPEKRSPADAVSGPITANAAALGLRRLDARLGFLGGARQALAYDARGVRKDVKGP